MSSKQQNSTQGAREILRSQDGSLRSLTDVLLSEVVRTLQEGGQGELAKRISHAARDMPAPAKPTTRYGIRMERYERELPPHNSETAEQYLRETTPITLLSGQGPAIVWDAKRHILDTYVKPGSNLASTAAAVRVSKEHLARRFRTHTGMTVMEYLHRIRISDALIGMTQSESLKAVGFEAGYGSYNDFYRNFRKRVGMSPKAVFQEMHELRRAVVGRYTG